MMRPLALALPPPNGVALKSVSVAGASVYFRGGSVIYTAYARSGFLDIPNP